MYIVYIHQYFTTPDDFGTLRSYHWCRKLIEAGHSVTVISGLSERTHNQCTTKSNGVSTVHIEGIEVKYIHAPYSNKLGLFQRALVFRRFANKAFHEIMRSAPDLIFASSTPLTVGLPAKRAAKKLDAPFVFEVRDLWPELIFAMGALNNPLAHYYLTHMERSIYKAAQHIIALSPGMKNGICRCGYDQANVTVIPNCCDIDLFRPKSKSVESKYGKPGDIRFVFAGAHGMANGLDAVLDGIAELKKRNFQSAHFIFIGDGSQKAKLQQRATDESLVDYVTWLGFMKKTQLAELLPRMDVGMMILKNIPEFYNGTSPNKFFDYIAGGLPVLNNYPGWLADMIEQHQCGLVAKPDDPTDFADKVELLCQSKKMRSQMSLSARQLAEREFSRDRLGEKFIRTLETVMKKNAVATA